MANLHDIYNVQESTLPAGCEFMFTSNGQQIIIKAVQYNYISQFESRSVYNVGFGDYDLELHQIIDQAKSNNGDAYKVFRTVLSTVPQFFEIFPDAVIIVQCSDSGSDFAEICKKTCIRKCAAECKRSNQRISIYPNFVKKYFAELSIAYWFLGGFVRSHQIMIEQYIPGRMYDAILLFQK
ncbi:DUF6934 family protein [Dyadobacter fanqingshengii]|uniref:Uncharacterized protein n=1 Tax=Dyadobacter fanqingshengii TaxID=2906443 RepID=A0A9X1T8A6_9BACT|nr:hypothetical protein [Dyadobacter fanqingshengii]MCF0039243.1 hypothetical protein [Dyadobacter fanqingshengii]USJ33940.1 hypothetical protein NFI81_14610 [Dyadobacter fanqingshengii]